ncbi:hypothetical protein [Streptomyces sp. WAC 05379]|uniref:hypothetical protein n=1 Tax=Streptomyces sp. WAC 05379 TaxID=2203207 RepID=UPI0026AD9156
MGRSNRLNHAGYLWAFSAITASPGAKAHYQRRRDDHGDWHAAGQRNLFNRMLGQLHHCLKNRRLFEERTAFPAPQGPSAGGGVGNPAYDSPPPQTAPQRA